MFGASAIGSIAKNIDRMTQRPAQAPQQSPAPMRRQPMNRATPMAYMADGGLVGAAARTCGCVGPSGGTGGVRGAQDYRK